jgi:hypothetical protein
MTRNVQAAALAALFAMALSGAATAQTPSEGGLYIADAQFTFAQAADRALAKNPAGQRFFVLTLPSRAEAVSNRASAAQVLLRERVVAAGGVLLVCQRDLDSGRIRPSDLTDGVVAARGWPPAGDSAMPAGQRYFAEEDRANLPASNEALRRLRSACT